MTGTDIFAAEGEGARLGAGAQLRSAREAAGLTLDEAAQHLKLAPRQVKALEDEDFASLPGRTFARGFVRNYARLLGLDADLLVSLLPDAARAPALESPALHPTSTVMGELPSATAAKPGSSRWLIPLALVACIIAAAGYEWYRSGRGLPDSRRVSEPSSEAPASVQPANANLSSATSADPAAAPTPLPSIGAGPAMDPAVQPGLGAQPGLSSGTRLDSTTLPNPLALAEPPAPAAAPDTPLVLTYRAPSRTEVRDGSGRVLISRVVAAGSVERLGGTPPFDVSLGNAAGVSMSFRGSLVDLGPYTRQNVARLIIR